MPFTEREEIATLNTHENGVSLSAAHTNTSGFMGETVGTVTAPVDEAQAAIERGKALLASGNFDESLSELTAAIRLAPENPDGYLLRGQVCEQQGEDERALADYSTALQLDVSQLLTFAQRLLAFTTKRDFASAVADADHSILVNQRLCRTCFLRSALYARQNEWAKAVVDYNQILQLDPANSLAFLRRGGAYAKLGEWAKAVADFTESLRLDPQSPETFNNRGEALMRLGQTDQALADFTAALKLDPQYAPARTNRADAHLRRGEYDQAITDYNQAIHLAPSSARPYAGRALARVEKGDWERALADLNKSLTLDPAQAHTSETQKAAERLRLAYEQVIAGLHQFKRLFRQTAEGIGTGRTELQFPEVQQLSISATPTQSQVQAPHAITAANTIEQTDTVLRLPASPGAERFGTQPSESTPTPSSLSESQASKEISLAEDDPGYRQRRLAARHCRKGQVFQKEGNHDRAVAAYTAALAVDPTCGLAYQERGLIHRLEGRLEEALEDFNTALELEPSAELYFRRGVAYGEQKQYQQAYADFEEALRRDPEHALTYLNRGMISVITGKFESAAEDADRALEIDASLTRARFLRGVAHGKLGRHDLAVEDFDVVLTQEPENARAHNHRGLAYAAEGKYDEAIAAYDAAIRLAPDLWAAHFNRGLAFHLKSDCVGAVEAFTRFIERRPQYASAYLQRGRAHQELGEFEKAIADFTQAFRLDPNLTEAYTSCMEATRLKYEKAERRTVATAQPPTAEPRHADSSPETRSIAAAGSSERLLPEPLKLPTPPSGKLQLECPECGTAGLLDMRHLGKKFRCPGCHMWWKTNSGGNLEATSKPEEVSATDTGSKSGTGKAIPSKPEFDSNSKSGVWKPVPAKAEKTRSPEEAEPVASAHLAAAAMLGTPLRGSAEATALARPAEKSKPAAKKGGGTVPRRQKEGGLRYAGMWTVAFLKTRTGQVSVFAVLVLLLFGVPFLFPSLFPSELRSRGQKVARAWLARDTEQIKSFTDPRKLDSLALWLETSPPPELNEEKGKAVVDVAVERNDGNTAEILIQIKTAKANGTPAYYVFRHRWVHRTGTWYLEPDPPTTPTILAGKG